MKTLLKSFIVLLTVLATNIFAGTFDGFEVAQDVTVIKADDFAHWDEDVETFNFCVISDLHGGEPIRKGYESFGSAREKFSLAVSHIAALSDEEKPAFVIVCGDIHLKAIKDIVDESGFAFYFIAGNHEKTEDRQLLRSSYPYFKIDGVESDYYSFVHNGCRFVGMCDSAYPEHVGHLSSEQIQPFGQSQWLISELRKQEKIKLVFGHIPPHPDCMDLNMYMSRNDCLFFNKLIEDTSPALMFFGHQHQPTRQVMIGATRCYIVRSLSWNADDAPIGYLSVNFSKDGACVKEYTFKEVVKE
jgi:predicted phosphodiesterase